MQIIKVTNDNSQQRAFYNLMKKYFNERLYYREKSTHNPIIISLTITSEPADLHIKRLSCTRGGKATNIYQKIKHKKANKKSNENVKMTTS